MTLPPDPQLILERAMARWVQQSGTEVAYPAAWLHNVTEMVTEFYERLQTSGSYDEAEFEEDVFRLVRFYLGSAFPGS